MRGRMGWKGAVCAAALGAVLAACATDPETPANRVELVSAAPADFHVGDTSALFVVSKTEIGATGREIRTNPYTSFHLVSSDSGIARVILAQQLVGLAPGTVKIVARDDNGPLRTDSMTVTVLP